MREILKIDGGIGRVLCATGPIRELSQNTSNEIVIITSWPEVFENNDSVTKVYRDGSIQYLFDDIIKYGRYHQPEPHHRFEYYTQQEHLITSFNELINDCDGKPYPEIFLTNEEISFGVDVVSKAKAASGMKKAIAYQPFGSGATMSTSGVIADQSFRSLNQVGNEYILDKCRKSVFINLSHIPINHNRCWNQQYSLRQFFAVAHACDFVVSIDSLLSHVGVAFGAKGVLILGSTYSVNVGYNEYYMYHTIQRSEYPMSYQSNRFGGHVEKNQKAMEFCLDEYKTIVSLIGD
jgi:ADP-heptose:LPS heptosyltransferase